MKRSFLLASGVVLAALLWRLLVLPLAFGELTGDPRSYVEIAHSILNGDGIVRHTSEIDYRAWYPPLYPILLAIVGLVASLAPPIFLALNFAIDLGTAAALLWLGRLLEAPASIAAAAFLFWPAFVLMSAVPNKEGLSALLAVLLLCCWLDRRCIAFGVLAGLLALTQPALVLLPAFFVLAMRFPGWVKAAAVSSAVAALIMLPWWIRNWLLFDQFVPLTTASGAGLWVGAQGDGIKWVQYPHEWMTGELRLSQALSADALSRVAAHPVTYLRLTLEKATTLFTGDIWGAKAVHQMHLGYNPPFVLKEIPRLLSACLFTGTAILAALRRSRIGNAVAASFAYILLVVIWFQFAERHHYFAVPLLLLLLVSELAYWHSRQKNVTPLGLISRAFSDR